jgi:two-component system LytT family response regulator
MRTLIVDDEPLARKRIRQFLAGEPDLEIVGESGDGIEAVRMIEALEPDLLFLDVQLPELDGFGVLESLESGKVPATIFITAYDKHAVRAFEVHAIDYLLKPFDRERFLDALGRARDLSGKGRPQYQPGLESLLAEVRKGRSYSDRFLVRSGDHYVLLKSGAIQWIEAENNHVRLHGDTHSYLLRRSMSRILESLNPRQFRRIHRSAIVNLDFVREIQPWLGGDMLILMRDGTELTLSRTYRDSFADWH